MTPPSPPTLYDFRLHSPWEAKEIFLRDELNAQKALGLLLDKPAWWHAWTAADPAVRTQWMYEMDAFLVRINLLQMRPVWRPNYLLDWEDLVPRLCEAVALPQDTTETKRVAIDAILNDLVTEIQSRESFRIRYDGSDDDSCGSRSEGEWDDNTKLTDAEGDEAIEGDDDSDDDCMLDSDDKLVSFEEACRQARQWLGLGDDDQSIVQSKDHELASETSREDDRGAIPFGQIAWVAGLLVLRERLLALAPPQATPTVVTDLVKTAPLLEDAETMDLTMDWIMAVLRADASCAIESVRTLIPVTLAPDTLCTIQHHFQTIQKLLEETKAHVATTLDIIVQQLELVALDGHANTLGVCTPGPVLSTWLKDACVSTELRAKLTLELADLRRSLGDAPSADPVVRDLVDPSLYCAIVGSTTYHFVPPSAALKVQDANPAMQMRALMHSTPTTTVPYMLRIRNEYQWLPCEIQVDSETRQATILSYINNLHPETYSSLYGSIEQLFTQCVPLFENVMSALDSDADERLLHALYRYGNCSLPDAPRLVPRGHFDVNPSLQSLHGTQCQVIVRIREVQLTPECPSFGGDDWHDEGTEAEEIIATAVLFYRVENLTDPKLACRTFVKFPMYKPDHNVTLGIVYGLYNQELVAQELGQITAVKDRWVDPTKSGMLGTLEFLLVAPMVQPEPIISTASVPPQQALWIQQERTRLFKQWGLPDSAAMLISALARDGMTEKEAQHNRCKAVAERRHNPDSSDFVWYHRGKLGTYY